MSEDDPTRRNAHPAGSGSFWKSRAGVVLIAFLAVAGLVLVYEHRVHIFTGNWILVGLLGACIVMHLLMHGSHGHGGHGGGSMDGDPDDRGPS